MPFALRCRGTRAIGRRLEGERFTELCPGETRVSGFCERGFLEDGAVQCVERIVTGEVMFTTPGEKCLVGVVNVRLPIADCRLPICR